MQAHALVANQPYESIQLGLGTNEHQTPTRYTALNAAIRS